MSFLFLYNSELNQIKVGFINVWSEIDYIVSLMLHACKQKEVLEN